MKTSAISNPAGVTSAATSSAKQSSAASDILFNQVLTREIADRSDSKVSEPSKPSAKESSPPSQAQQSARAANGSNKTNSAQEGNTPSVEEGKTKPVAEGAPGAAQESHAKAGPDAGSDDDKAELVAASDELLAFVASLNKIVTGQFAVAATAEDSVQDVAAPLISATAQDVDASLIAATAPDGDGATAGDVALAVGTDQANATARAGVTELLNGRVSSDAKAKDAAPPADFDAALAQAKDGKDATAAAAPTGATATQSAQTEFTAAAAAQSAPDARTAKAAQDTQAAAPINLAPQLQAQAPLQQVQAAAAQAADRLTPRVGSQGWDQALGQKVVWMVAGSQQSASLTLNPPDLGPLQVVLSVSNNQATANFTAAQPEVRQALENAMPKLREMLGDAGIQLGQANVSAGTPNNQQGTFGDQPRSSSRHSSQTGDSTTDTPVHLTRTQQITGGQGLVDTFA